MRTVKVYSLSAAVSPDGPILRGRRPMWHAVTTRQRPTGIASGADDVNMMHTHGTTHVDALCHIYMDDTLYNGHPSSALTPFRAQYRGVDNVGPIVGRGVLLNVAAWCGVEVLADAVPIEPSDLDACAAAEGVEVRPADIVLVRTGWWRLFSKGPAARDRFYAAESEPSGAARGHWFRAHDAVALGADNPGVEAVRSWSDPLRLRHNVIWGFGGYLLEFLDLEALSRDRVYAFLFAATPLRIDGGIGSPIAPVAIE